MLRFATIGSGSIVQSFVEASVHCPAFKLEAVYSRDAEKAAELAEKWGAAQSFSSLEQLAACPDIDAVYIASPNLLHASQTELFLNNGKHVLCEKPVVTNTESFDRLLEIAQDKNLVFMEAMRPAHIAAYGKIKNAISQIGPVRRVSLVYCQYSSRYDNYKNGIVENAFDPTLQNGALMDIGVYCVAVMIMLLGAPSEVTAKGWFLSGSIDAAGSILAEYHGGLQAQLAYSKVNNSFLPSEIQGEYGCIQFTPLSTVRSAKIIFNNGEEQIIPCDTPDLDMQCEINDFIRIVENGEDYDMYTQITRDTLVVMDEARSQIGIEFMKVIL